MSALIKADIRLLMLHRLQGLAPTVWTSAAGAMASLLETLPAWATAKRVAVYLSLPDEIPTASLIDILHRRGTEIYLPVYDAEQKIYLPAALHPEEELQRGKYGLGEPVRPRWAPGVQLDLVLVPGRAFSREGMRVGRGAGYYDRFLTASWAAAAVRVGLSLECQLVDHDAQEPHDARMTWVVTERRVYGAGSDFCSERNA